MLCFRYIWLERKADTNLGMRDGKEGGGRKEGTEGKQIRFIA